MAELSQTQNASGSAPALCDFLRLHQREIMDDWLGRVRAVSPAHDLPASALIDHLPAILGRLGTAMGCEAEPPPSLADTGESHAIDRLGRGFDLDDVFREYALLRQCILDRWALEAGDFIRVSDLRTLDAAVEEVVSRSIVEYAQARERLLQAVDRIADAAAGSADVDTFLHHLLRVTLETATAVDTVAVLLREGELLRVRAATGLDREVELGFTLHMGEGFAGTIAAEGTARALTAASDDPLVRSPLLRKKGLKALFGVPLVHNGTVVGVAHMGSITAREFSDEDKLLFRAMANRATAVIVQADLVERERRARRQAEETSALLDTLLARAPAGFAFLDRELRYQRINPALAEIHGVDVAGHLGRTVREVLPPEAAKQVEPRLRQVLATGEPLVAQLISGEMSLEGGERRHLLVSYYPVPEPGGGILGLGAVTADITERRREEERQQFLADAGRQLGASLDSEQVLASIPRLAVPTLGASCVVYEIADDRLRRAASEPPRPGADASLAMTPALVELLGSEGSRRYEALPEPLAPLVVEPSKGPVVLAPLRARQRSLGLLVVGDAVPDGVTEALLVEEFARRAAIALDNANLYREAQRATAIREQVLAVVSHDLKNPITVIQMATQALRRGEPDAKLTRQLDGIDRSLDRMNHLIADLLDMASIQSGQLAVNLAPRRVDELLAAASQLHEPLAHERGLRLVTTSAVPPELQVAADHQRLQQVFGNLIGNAIKFSPAGAAIAVSGAVRGDEVVFSVADQGPGIAPDEVARIFDPYWSGQRHGQRSTGLGLFISRGIVRAHGGRIWVESQPGSGSAFRFALPLQR